MPTNLLCVFRSPVTVSDNCKNTIRKVIDGIKINISFTIGVQENNDKYLNLLSENGFISFVNVYTRLPKGYVHSCLDRIFINGNEYLSK